MFGDAGGGVGAGGATELGRDVDEGTDPVVGTGAGTVVELVLVEVAVGSTLVDDVDAEDVATGGTELFTETAPLEQPDVTTLTASTTTVPSLM